MFDFDQAVSKWRDSLNDADALTASDVKELEGHLREETARVEALGLSQEEAFMVACKRIGRPSALNIEFEKENPTATWRKRMFWFVLGMIGYWVWYDLASSAYYTMYVLVSVIGFPVWAAIGVPLLVWALVVGLLAATLRVILTSRFAKMGGAICARINSKFRVIVSVLLVACGICGVKVFLSRAIDDLVAAALHANNALVDVSVLFALTGPVVLAFLLGYFYDPRQRAVDPVPRDAEPC